MEDGRLCNLSPRTEFVHPDETDRRRWQAVRNNRAAAHSLRTLAAITDDIEQQRSNDPADDPAFEHAFTEFFVQQLGFTAFRSSDKTGSGIRFEPPS